MPQYQIECVFDEPSILGESPLWHYEEQVLYWVDIEKPALHCLDPETKEHCMWLMPAPITCIGMRAKGGLIAAMRYGFAKIASSSGQVTMVKSPITDTDGVMFNDGKCDRAGNFWAGTKNLLEQTNNERLYRLDSQGHCTEMGRGFVVTNGIVWSPDTSIMYVCDSLARIIYQYEFTIETGEFNNKKVFAQLAEESGYPDGLVVDSEGGIWNAHWDGWCITRYLPSGKINEVIKLPVQRPTSCCFGGSDLTTLYVSSASSSMSEYELKHNPQAGCVFAIQVGVKGLPEPQYLG